MSLQEMQKIILCEITFIPYEVPMFLHIMLISCLHFWRSSNIRFIFHVKWVCKMIFNPWKVSLHKMRFKRWVYSRCDLAHAWDVTHTRRDLTHVRWILHNSYCANLFSKFSKVFMFNLTSCGLNLIWHCWKFPKFILGITGFKPIR